MKTVASLVLLLSSTVFTSSFATHIRAGEITAVRESCQGFTYTFTITGYEDTGSSVEFGDGTLSFGYGTAQRQVREEEFVTRKIINNEDEIRVTTFEIEHTFPGPGSYPVSYRESFRNEGILNMDNSVGTDFYVETLIIIDPLFCNNTPVLTSEPVDAAAIGTTFLHNPGAFDPDGDSLSYKLVLPEQAEETPVGGYRYPDEYDRGPGANPAPVRQDGNTPVALTLDPLTGTLTWDAPANEGEYNVAFIIEEWRQVGGEWIRIGYVTRDMQILVKDSENNPPELAAVRDTCIEAGNPLELTVTATDEDGDPVVLTAFGEPLELRSGAASFLPGADQEIPTPAEGTFRWTPSCRQVREAVYQINFKAADVPAAAPPLVDFEVWNITVVAPAPQEVTATLEEGRSSSLQWAPYACADAAETMQVYRRIGSDPFTPGSCDTGLPEGAGYTLISELPPDLVGYGDSELQPGLTYCYRLVAVYANGSESLVSEEVCVRLPATAPLITEVSVRETGPASGRMAVAWVAPPDIDSVAFPGPYTYTVVRGVGFGGTEERTVIAENVASTELEDTGLNTTDQVYHYRVYLYDATGQLADSSATASSVRLERTPQTGGILLDWAAAVPWNNRTVDYPYHYIYRGTDSETDDGLVLIDSVRTTEGGFTYRDQNVSDQQGYCYVVTTQGQYDNQPLLPAPLFNQSQRVCAQPYDSVPPCPPPGLTLALGDSEEDCAALLADKPCSFNAFSNTLTWTRSADTCAADVNRYNVYFSAIGTEDEPYELIATGVTDTFYVDGPLPSLAGCYRVAAVDRSGNESAWSEPICRDNCPYYELPNVFTPNGDGINDTFQAYNEPFAKCPRFVRYVVLRVYNRWGKQVYAYDSRAHTERENRIFIHWDGVGSNGKKVSAGVYYYQAKVGFVGLDPDRPPRALKGWVQVMYEETVGR